MSVLGGHTEAAPRADVAARARAKPERARATRGPTRPEIQALRAVAVLLVVLYHLWPSVVPGGFVGVDVFFAISGFLITSLLLREIDGTGTISLTRFWARRARRILPAALLLLLFCAVATVAVVPQTAWPQFLGEVRASAVYVQNWHLAGAAVDYLHASDPPSAVQHYWSLSAEEQFYVVWPAVLLAVALLTRRHPAPARRTALAATMVLLTGASLAWSLHDTAADTAAAYFVTPTRAWEFGAGGLLALAGPAGTSRGHVALSWIGLAAIVTAALTFSDATPFPGYAAALPVLGAIAVIRAGTPARRWSPRGLLTFGPVQFLGDISYSVYLWHWPLLVLVPFAIGRPLTTVTGIAVVMTTVLAAWLTKVAVEDPVRASGVLARHGPAWTFALAAAATAVVLGAAAGGMAHLRAQADREERAATRILASHPSCFGAAARDPRRPCANPRLRRAVVPSPLEARTSGNAPCTVVERRGRLRVCAFGITHGRASSTVALVGDSHASTWRAALADVARRRGWRGLSITHTSCPFSTATADIVEPERSRCAQWNRQLRAWFADHPEVRTVFVGAHSSGHVIAPGPRTSFDAQVAGYTAAWRALPRSVTRVVVLRDTPRMRESTIACVQQAVEDGRAAGRVCAVPRRVALRRDPQVIAARRLGADRVGVVDLTPQMCSRRSCLPVIGGALVARDRDHVTPVFARTLAPFVERELDAMPAVGP